MQSGSHILRGKYCNRNTPNPLSSLPVGSKHTKRRDCILFVMANMDHFKAKQGPMMRAMSAWNSLIVQTRNVNTKEQLKVCLKNTIVNPYSKIEKGF